MADKTFKILAICLAAVALIGGAVLAQEKPDGKSKPYVPRKVVLSPEPVTRDEARKIIEKVNKAFVKVMPRLKPVKPSLTGTQPVTRTEIITQFNKLFEMAKAEFKFTPRKVAYNASVISVKDPEAKTKVQNLIAWGCVDKVGPLATSDKETLGVLEFGDAVGLLVARVAELTHTADPRFSPDLMP
jgi:hypothetical protein